MQVHVIRKCVIYIVGIKESCLHVDADAGRQINHGIRCLHIDGRIVVVLNRCDFQQLIASIHIFDEFVVEHLGERKRMPEHAIHSSRSHQGFIAQRMVIVHEDNPLLSSACCDTKQIPKNLIS